jgi:hypothetical protein
MVLPQGISKTSGLEACLAMVRLSTHNTAGIGDAENDHAMLQTCELGLAVAWGSETLKKQADAVLPDTGPADVGRYLDAFAQDGHIPLPVSTRRHLLLGHRDHGSPFSLSIRGRNLLVAGDPKSGKSWVVGYCASNLFYTVTACAFSIPKAIYIARSITGVAVFGGSDPLPKPRDLVKALRHADTSVVVDLSKTSHEEKLGFVRNLLPAVATLRRSTGLPHRIVLDEAHYFLKDPEELILNDLREGGYTLATIELPNSIRLCWKRRVQLS